ncbi:MAG: caspase family protein, partial [Pseudomonadota bacterium]
QDAAAGDLVYIHLSGHGTQQPDLNGDETDGVDEVFLPADSGRAAPGTTTIPNAIVDEEFGSRVAALRAEGADVWFVLDSCHAGSGLRAGSPRIADRYVDPRVLGISLDTRPDPATTPIIEGPGNDALPGRFVAFYAAQSSELAREIQIDENAPDSWYGLFTSRLAARLQRNDALSYRQLFQAILSDLNDGLVPGAARLQTPLWDGNMIDAAVFGGGDTIGVRQFATRRGQIQAGKLHGLRDGTLVALVSDAAAEADDILGFAQLERTGAHSAGLAAVGGDCSPSIDDPCPRFDDLPQDARFARIVAEPLDTAILIAPPVDLKTGDPLSEEHPLASALADAIKASNADHGTRLRLDVSAPVLSGAYQGALWFGTGITAGTTPMGLRWAPSDGQLSPLLVRIAAAEKTAALLGSVAGTPSLLFPAPVAPLVELGISDATALAPQAPADLGGECSLARQTVKRETGLLPGRAVKQCDSIRFGAIGVVQGRARDVNLVHIDSQFCVRTAYQRVEGTSKPALIGDEQLFCSDCPSGPSAGAERAFFVVTEAAANREALNLVGQLDNCGTGVAGASTRSASRQVVGFLNGLGQRNATRGTMGSAGITNVWVEQFSWQVLPRHEARVQAGLEK